MLLLLVVVTFNVQVQGAYIVGTRTRVKLAFLTSPIDEEREELESCLCSNTEKINEMQMWLRDLSPSKSRLS